MEKNTAIMAIAISVLAMGIGLNLIAMQKFDQMNDTVNYVIDHYDEQFKTHCTPQYANLTYYGARGANFTALPLALH